MASTRANTGSDWASRPSALFAAALLGLVSLTTMLLSLSRQLHAEPAPIVLDAHPAQPAPAAPMPRASAVRLIDVNAAGLGELDLLPGIGPALGQRIIDYRNEHGPFASVDDLQRVSGIGPRTLDKMRSRVTLGDAGGYTIDN